MSTHLRLRAVPPPALRNSATWLDRMFEDDSETVRHHLDQERIYAGPPPCHAEDRPRTHVVLGGRPVFRPDPHKPPLLVLTAAQTRRVAGFLATADFDALWLFARDALLPHYGGVTAEPETWGAFASTHRELTAFYAQTAACGNAVVKLLPEPRETQVTCADVTAGGGRPVSGV